MVLNPVPNPSVAFDCVADEDGRTYVRLVLIGAQAHTAEGDPCIILDAEETLAIGSAALSIGHVLECGGTVQ